MRALILTAGLGTRLRPLTYVRAKAAVPVNGTPLARRVIAWLAAEGIDDVVLNLHHRPDTIAAVVGDGADLGARVRYSWENPILGSGGGPRRALPLLVDAASSTFLIVNGDTLTNLSLRAAVDRHRASGAAVTMALVPNPRPDQYGGVLVAGGFVTGFTRRGDPRESFHFIGVQVAEAGAFSRLPEGVPAETVMMLYPQLISEEPGAVAAHVVDAPFHDVGTPADYLQTSLDLAAVEGDRLVSGRHVDIDPTAELDRTAVWDDVVIGRGSRLEQCIVCDAARIPPGSAYRRCAIAPHGGGPAAGSERIEGGLVIRQF